MAVVVSTNVSSLIAQSNLTNNTNALSRVMEQLSSGVKINRASDDAAGLSISENMKIQISGNNRAQNNIGDAQNLLAIAEGGMESATKHIQRIRELCVQAANETYDDSQKENILIEIEQRLEDMNVTAENTKFNGVQLLNGTNPSLKIQTGANSDEFTNSIDVGNALSNVHTTVAGLDIDLEAGTTGATWTTDKIHEYMDKLDAAIDTITSDRAKLGAYGNRLDATYTNLDSMSENLTEANSRILDTDVAAASSDLVKYQILQQTSASILTQANQMPSIALSLLQG